MKRFRVASSLTTSFSGLQVVSSFDNIAEAITAADNVASNARFNGVPLKLVFVVDAWSGRIAKRFRVV